MSRDLKEAIIAAGHEPGIRLSKPGPLYSPPPSPDEQLEYLVWLALNNPHIYARLLGRLLPRKRPREYSMPDVVEPFRSEEEAKQAYRDAGIPFKPVYPRREYEPVPQDDVEISSNQEVKKRA